MTNTEKFSGSSKYIIYGNEVLPRLLTAKEENSLARQIKKGSRKEKIKARNLFIESNLKLVINIAKSYEHLGVEFEDLVGEGNIGLMIAVDRFSPLKGARFSTYAGFWIRQRITRVLCNNSGLVRLPVYLKQIHLNVRKYESAFEEANQRYPTNKEISKKFGISENKVLEMKDAVREVVHLDSSTTDKKGADAGELNEVIPDETVKTASEEALLKNENKCLYTMIGKLSEREQMVIKCRFGLLDYECETLEAVGRRFDITRERIRQIETIALKKLKTMSERDRRINV